MKEVFDFKNQISSVVNSRFSTEELSFGSLRNGLFKAYKKCEGKKIEIVTAEKEFKKQGQFVVQTLKSFGAEVTVLTVEDKSVSVSAIKSALSLDVGVCFAVGDSNLLSVVRYASSLYNIPCYAVLTSPLMEDLLSEKACVVSDGTFEFFTADKFEKVFIDEDFILKSKSENFAEAYASSASKLTALIDYKMGCFLSGTAISEELFTAVQKAVSIALSYPLYENGKSAILASQVILACINALSGEFAGLGAQGVKLALGVYASEAKGCKKSIMAFEKTLKLYHMFFTNDFSTLLSAPDYLSEVETLSSDFKKDSESFYSNLKIPSEKRRRLILLLLEKTADSFIAETSAILKAFGKIKKAYSSLIGVAGDGNISYKQIKNSVVASPYLTDKTTVYTIMRDLGVLACAN